MFCLVGFETLPDLDRTQMYSEWKTPLSRLFVQL